MGTTFRYSSTREFELPAFFSIFYFNSSNEKCPITAIVLAFVKSFACIFKKEDKKESHTSAVPGRPPLASTPISSAIPRTTKRADVSFKNETKDVLSGTFINSPSLVSPVRTRTRAAMSDFLQGKKY